MRWKNIWDDRNPEMWRAFLYSRGDVAEKRLRETAQNPVSEHSTVKSFKDFFDYFQGKYGEKWIEMPNDEIHDEAFSDFQKYCERPTSDIKKTHMLSPSVCVNLMLDVFYALLDDFYTKKKPFRLLALCRHEVAKGGSDALISIAKTLGDGQLTKQLFVKEPKLKR